MTLGDFLLTAANSRTPGNCSTLAADWCLALGYPDFAAAWRHIVGDAESDEAAAGGLVPLWEQGIGEALPLALPPFVAGDIGVAGIGEHQAGAVFTGERWAFRRPRGLRFAPLPDSAILKAWRPCPAH